MGLIVVLFAGGGGSSCGIRDALGRDPDVAVNHDRAALAMHEANHPGTRHIRQDVWQVSPKWASRGETVDLLWASPDCTHFSKAKGGPPERSERIRDLAWVVEKWASAVSPRLIILENVEEFRDWGPLDKSGVVIKSQRGATFTAFVRSLRRLGYAVQWQDLVAADYGAPTSRKRLFMIARNDGLPIIWPKPTHGKPGNPAVLSGALHPWRTAGEIIDWSLPCPSIFERKKPLAKNTLRRIARGIRKYVIESAAPFIVTIDNGSSNGGCCDPGSAPLTTVIGKNRHVLVVPTIMTNTTGHVPWDVREPLPTQTTGNHHYLVAPTLIQTGYGEREGQAPRVPGLGKPLGTIVAGGVKHALVAAFMAQHNGGAVGHKCNRPLSTITGRGTQQQLVACHLVRQFGNSTGQSMGAPAGTIMPGGSGKTCLVASSLVKFKGTSRDGQSLNDPLHTIQGSHHYAEVRTFLTKYYGTANGQSCREPVHTITGHDRMGLVTVMIHGQPHVIVDIGMRMLTPRELFLAQGFPSSYRIDVAIDGKPVSKATQVKLCGNSVPPQFAAALVTANFTGNGRILREEIAAMNQLSIGSGMGVMSWKCAKR